MTAGNVLTRLGEYLRARRLVIFCGVGIQSRSDDDPAGRAFWWQLPFMTDDQRQAQFRVAQAIDDNEAPLIHRWLVQLDAQWYVTTNCDRVLDKALTRYHGADHIAIVKKDADLPSIRTCRSVCVKMHGDVNDVDLLVMSRSDYRERVRHPRLVDALLRYLFASHPVLFIATASELENIIETWDETNRNFPTPPERYLLQLGQDNDRMAYLERLGVKRVLADPLPAKDQLGSVQQDNMIVGFLERLWEQTSPFGDFLFHDNGQQASIEERIGTAIDLRRNGNLEAAQRQLSIIRIEPRIPANQLPRLLWLTVSLYDKLEKLDILRDLEPQIAQWRTAVREAPPAVLNAINVTYDSALSVAHLRALNLEDAWRAASRMLSWCPTEVAQRDFQLLRANALTIYAMVAYCRWVCRSGIADYDILTDARTCLMDADKLYRNYPTPPGTESHYRGRYYGTLAFIETAIALRQDNIDDHTVESIERNAEMAHKNGQDRTKFGRIAGLYCHAHALASFAERYPDRGARASELLDDAFKSLPESNQIARAKVKLLQSRIRHDGITSAAVPKEARSLLAKTNIEVEQWLRLPLN